MVEIDLGPVLRKAIDAHLKEFKEEVQILRAEAWREGYEACENGEDISSNPYQKKV